MHPKIDCFGSFDNGGGWVVGDKREQGLPLLHHVTRSGWIGVSINYRLSPGADGPTTCVT